jgi:fructose-1-phosphate kinase PfkB-like protein
MAEKHLRTLKKLNNADIVIVNGEMPPGSE